MGMPFGIRVDRSFWVTEGVSAEFFTHLADREAAVFAGMRAVVDDSGTSEREIGHLLLSYVSIGGETRSGLASGVVRRCQGEF